MKKIILMLGGFCFLFSDAAGQEIEAREVYKSEITNPTRPDPVGKSEIKINVLGFSQGLYFVELKSGENVLRGKFLKQ